jgi:hypothetical protein
MHWRKNNFPVGTLATVTGCRGIQFQQAIAPAPVRVKDLDR